MLKIIFVIILFIAPAPFVSAQQKSAPAGNTGGGNTVQIPVSKADLGVFPYFKTFPNFKAVNTGDSLTIEQNRVYFFDGKKFFTVDGKVSSQKLNVVDDGKKQPSQFQMADEFDKIVATLGGKKVFTGKFPVDLLKPLAGSDDIVSLSAANQLVHSAFYGVAEYVIKTPEKEVWVQLQPYSIASGFYTLLVVEKQSQLLTTNTNKENGIVPELEKSKKAVLFMSFVPDSATLLTESKDEILSLAGVFQAHPDWKIKIEVNNAPVGRPDYILSLTQRRAEKIKEELVSLGVAAASVDARGMGDGKPLTTNDTERGRIANTRVEIIRL